MNGPVAAVIPARGGSTGLPGKNLAPVAGIPLVARAVYSARATGSIDYVYVSTDSSTIAAAAATAGAEVIDRPAHLATDTASSEAALLHACDQIEGRLGTAPSVMVFIQATSPFILAKDLEAGVRKVREGLFDSLFSAVETYEFLWAIGPDGAVGINHDSSNRPRRQDREPHYRETGAFYVVDWLGFRERGHRFFGRVGVQVVPQCSGIEVDTAADLALARTLSSLFPSSMLESVSVEGLVMDFDGVHTDDHALVDQEGRELVRVSRSDGMGIGMLRDIGLPMLILSKERNLAVKRRGEKLGVPVRQGVDDKAAAVREWASEAAIDLDRVAYVGNDVNDLPAMEAVGLPVAVPDAHPAVLRLAKLHLSRPGGTGAIRELSEIILDARRQDPHGRHSSDR